MDRLPDDGEVVLAWWGERDVGLARLNINRSGWTKKHGLWWIYAERPVFWVSLTQAKAAPQMAAALRGIGRCGVCETCSAAARAASRPAPDVDAIARETWKRVDGAYYAALHNNDWPAQACVTAIIREAIEKGRGEGSPPS
jgi:hypothetical protein